MATLAATRGCRFALLLACAPIAAAAVAAPPADPQVRRDAAGSLRLTWRAAGPVDVLEAARPDTPVSAARLVSARDADGAAEVAVPTGARRYFLLRDVQSGAVTRVAERVLPLAAGSNFRDIGGYPAANGRHVKWGLIYRSGATPLLTEGDQGQIKALGLAEMIDLRSDEERVLAPSRIEGIPYLAVGYRMGALMTGTDGSASMDAVYRRLPAMMAPQLKLIFAALLRGEGPLVYNCSAGQDRTGFATAVVLSALGTPYPVIVSDYHLSTTYRRPEFEMPRLDAAQHPNDPVVALFARYQDDPRARQPQPLKTAEGKPYLDFAFAEMQAKWGGVDGYLKQSIGLTDRDIAHLRSQYTD